MSYLLSQIGGIKNAIIVKSGISTTTSDYYTDAILDDWIDDAHKWAASYKKWPMVEGRNSTTFSSSVSDEYGNYIMEYPEGYRSDSIRFLTIGGKEYEKKNFYEFMKFRELNPQSDQKIFTDRARLIYVNPVGGITGTMTAFGQYIPARLDGSDPTIQTIFSTYDEDGNHAIVKEVLSYIAQREKKGQAEVTALHDDAMKILDGLWEGIKDEQAQYQTLPSDGMFRRFDVLRGGFEEDTFRRDQFF